MCVSVLGCEAVRFIGLEGLEAVGFGAQGSRLGFCVLLTFPPGPVRAVSEKFVNILGPSPLSRYRCHKDLLHLSRFPQAGARGLPINKT